jgi:hypothetical protein
MGLDVEEGHAHGAGLAAHLARGQPEVVGARLGEAIARLEVHAAGEEALEHGQRARGAAADEQLQPGEVHRVEAWVALHLDEHGGHAEDEAHRAPVDEVEHARHVEGAAHHGRAARVHQRGGEDVEAARVE